MALYVQFISPMVETVEKRIQIGTGFVNFCDEKGLFRFIGTNIIDLSHPLMNTDVIVHVCSNVSDRALFSAGTNRDVSGMTNVETIDGVPSEAYSEVWADDLVTKFGLNLNESTGLINLGRLIAITALHEAMHNKVEPFKQIKSPKFNLHKNGGGGVAEPGASIIMTNEVWDAPVTAGNLKLISEFFNLPLKQIRRTK